MRRKGEIHLGKILECEKIEKTYCKCRLAKNFDNKIQNLRMRQWKAGNSFYGVL